MRKEKISIESNTFTKISIMHKIKYTEEEIEWAINELKKKYPEKATREQAISLLNTLKELPKFVVEKITEDKESVKSS